MELPRDRGDASDIKGAMRIRERVLEPQRRLGNLRGVAGSLGNIASLLQYQPAGRLGHHGRDTKDG
jgi:hypothetical protein